MVKTAEPSVNEHVTDTVTQFNERNIVETSAIEKFQVLFEYNMVLYS